MNSGIYVRISQDRNGEGLGVGRQREDCQKLADSKGWTVAEVYEDNDVSATKAKPRPAYERLMQDLRDGKINAVVVWDVDRLTRHPMELEHFIQLAENQGVKLANVSGDIDLSDDNGRMMARIKGALARMEAEKMGKRLKRQKQQRAEQGKPPAGGRYRTLGYTRDWKVVPEEAAVIKDAFRRAIAGESLQSIADHWTATGVSMGNGKTVYFSTVNNVLKRHLYAGITVHNGQIMGKSQVPPIVDEATFEAAQKAMAERDNVGPRGKNARQYLLSGIIRCECLSPMGAGPQAKNKKTGIADYKYACRKAVGGCGKVSISGPAVERIALHYVRQSLIVRGNKHAAPKVDYQPELDRIDSEIAGIQSEVASKVITPMQAVPMYEVLNAERKELIRKDADQITEDEGGFDDWEDFMWKANLSEQKAILNRVIKLIIVHKNDGSTVFNPERVTLTLSNDTEHTIGRAWNQAKRTNPKLLIATTRDGEKARLNANRKTPSIE